jgi:alpha-L-rhamnosidase
MTTSPESAAPQSARAPRELRCEYQVDPIGLGARQPRLFWKLDDERPGAAQSAWRVLVASDPERLARDEGDLWDSGRVSSNQNAHVVYEGVPLASRARACWKLQSFDAAGEPSPWSAPARFELGLLEPADWTARWVASPLAGAPKTSAPVPALRREFRLDGAVARARLYVTALGLYEVELNGRRVGDQQLAPGWTDFGKRVRYQAYDVTALLRPGENAIGALLGDGWYCGFTGLVKTRENYGRRPALLAQLEVVLEDGSELRVESDASWRWRTSCILESDIMQGEVVDARRDLGAWTRSGYDDSAWAGVELASDPGISLDAMTGPPVRATRELAAVNRPQRSGHPLFGPRWIFDLGQNMVGRVRLRVRGREGTTVQLRHAEVLDPKGELYTENLRDARALDTFTLRGTGEPETFEPRFSFHGFRYVEVAGRLEEGAVEELVGVVLHSDMKPTGEFACSDADLNRLQSNIVWGQRGNFLDVPTDCPQRDERLGWTGDAQVFVRTAAFNMDVAGFFSKWLLDLEDAQAHDGLVPPIAPLPGRGLMAALDGGPAWADAIVICPWTIYRCFADERLLDERFDGALAYVDYLERRFPNGVRSDPSVDPWGGFGDWCALDGTLRQDSRMGGTPKDLIGTAFLAHSARRLAEIAGVIGRFDEEKRLRELASRVRDAFRRRFVTPDGLVAGNTQTSFVLALHFGLLESREREVTARALAHDVEQHGHLTTGFVGTPYLLHVLSDVGRLDLAYRLLLRREFPSWLFPVVKGGATTIWERWDGWTEEKGFFDPEMNSFNHYAYGAVGEWLYGTLAGLDLDPDPGAAGWRRARLAPRPPVHRLLPEAPPITSARAALETGHGRYETVWSIERDRFTFDARVPPGCSARVDLPDGRADEVSAGRHRFETSLDAIRERS